MNLRKKPEDTAIDEVEAGRRYAARQAALEDRLRRHCSLSLLQRLQMKERAVAHMGGCCQICGYFRCKRALEFHHLDKRDKQFSISTYITKAAFCHSMSNVWFVIERELRKCILLCANCHREVESGVVNSSVINEIVDRQRKAPTLIGQKMCEGEE